MPAMILAVYGDALEGRQSTKSITGLCSNATSIRTNKIRMKLPYICRNSLII